MKVDSGIVDRKRGECCKNCTKETKTLDDVELSDFGGGGG